VSNIVCRQMAIDEVVRLMTEYTEFLRTLKDQVLTSNVREELRRRAEKFRWIQNGLENGFYDD
jgi:hypothetical protein